jgi:hypothetical protein
MGDGPFRADCAAGVGAVVGTISLPSRQEDPFMHLSPNPPRLADSAVTAGINGAINAAIAWSGFKGSASVPLSMDSIGSPGVTALGNAAPVAFSLTFIITCITFFVFRAAARKSGQAPSVAGLAFVPGGVGIALSNTLLVFGGFVAIAVLWQRFAGTIAVGPVAATLVVAAVAALATAIAETRTKREMLARGPAAR